MRKLIINADDLGMSIEVNRQIEECINLGCITSSTLMANAPAFEEGVRIAKQYPHISVGAHLNIIEFKPLTNIEIFKKHGIVGKDGSYIEGAVRVVEYDEELLQSIYEEWDAQITKIESTGIIPTHCDSHEHTHTIPALQVALRKVLDKHNIKRVRRKSMPSIRLMLREKKQPIVQYDKSKAMMPKKRNVLYRRFHLFVVKYLSYNWNKIMSRNYLTTSAFYSFRDFFFNKDILALGGRDSVIELMCHPGNAPFQMETDCLKRDKSWLEEGYVLSTYRDL